MNIGMTVFNNNVDNSSITVTSSLVSTSRGGSLNPEASVFHVCDKQDSKVNATAPEGDQKQALLMNGFTSKEVCGEQCSKAEPLCPKVFPEANMSSAENAYESSTPPTEKMTETAAALPEEEQNGSVVYAGSSNTADADRDSMNGVQREMEGDKVDQDIQEEDKNDDTGQARDNNDVPSNITGQAEKTNDEPLTRERIKELLGQNIEFFFSRENWSSDPYLLSQMDSDQYVPVYILANCSQFKSLTGDHSIIMEALKDSLFVQLDEEKNRVRPNYKRCIVILREIPKSTPVKEIEAMFEGEGCPKVVSCEFVHNDFWYVTFESDSDAQKAYRYLRETVKTFMDKPILARIKTKPMSRIGCLSVLPSYSGKAPVGESRDGTLTPQAAGNVNPGGVNAPGVTPAGPGIQGIPSPHPPPNAYPNNSQRMFYTPQSSINPPFHNYNFAGSTLPTAYFYPNPLMQWTSPNFYDINSFIQYNGLSPRAAFKPPTNARFSNNGNSARRNKNRDPKFDKNETRHLSSGSNGSGVGGSQQQLRHTQPNRPQSAQSPHLCNQAGPHNSNLHHSLSSNQTAGQLPHIPKGDSHSNISNTINSINNNNSNLVQTNHNSFAQNDLSLASQSNLYTSFSPPAGMSIPRGGNTVKVEKLEKGELSSHGVLDSTEASNIEDNSSEISEAVISIADSANTTLASPTSVISTTISQNYSHSTSLVSNSIISSQVPPQSSIGSQQMHPHHHHHHYHQSMPASHRSAFNNESHPGRDSQPQRQISRGGRRRVSRRDEEINGHSSSGNSRGSQRGAAQNNGDLQSKSAEVEKPFELQATSFPPLPTADEIAASSHEDKSESSSSQVAWSGETHKFSDVMKGTAKPKHFPSPSITTTPTTTATVTTSTITVTTTMTVPEKEVVDESLVASSENNSSVTDLNAKLSEGIVLSTNPESNTIENTNHNNNINNNSTTVHTSCSVSDNGTNTSNANTSISNTTTTTTTTTTTSLKTSSEGTSVGNSSLGRQDRPAAPREERRNVGMQVIRREREFIAGIGRGGPRNRDVGNFRMSGNKENRPQAGSNRSWREDRVDPDGWITKGPRDTRAHRDHRYNHQHNFYESRNFSSSKPQTIVNGDASPPPPPKPEVSPKSVENNLLKTTTTTTTTTATTPPTNSVKHFTKPESKSLKSEVVDKEKQTTSGDGEHKTSWAKMALASKDQMERLSAELKEKEEQERQKKRTTKLPTKTSDRLNLGREGKQFRRENFSPREREKEFAEKGREFRGGAGAGAGGGPDRNAPFGFKPREALRPKSPK